MLNRVIVRYADSKCTDIYPDKTDQTYYVENRHLNNFLIAFIKLHHTPGINPHNNCETTKLSYLGVQKQSQSRKYWWSSPTLDDPEAVPYYEFEEPTPIYMSSFMNSEIIIDNIESSSLECASECCPKSNAHVQYAVVTDTCSSYINPDFLEYFDQTKDGSLSFNIKEYYHDGDDDVSEESDLGYEEIILDHSMRQRDTRCRNACVTLVLSLKRHNVSKDCRSVIAKKVWQSHQNAEWE